MSANPDSVVSQGEFHSSVPPSKTNANDGPTIHNKFKPGGASPPEFTTEVLPAGTAPASKTHKPNAVEEAGGQSYIPGEGAKSSKETWVMAEDTITGASSKDVYNTDTMGKPFQGKWTQSDAKQARHRGDGVEGVGSSPVDPKEAMGATKDHENPKGGKLKDPELRQTLVGAEEREPQTAEAVAAELGGK